MLVFGKNNSKTLSYIPLFIFVFCIAAIRANSQPPPALAITAFPFVESFEYVYGQWEQDEADDFDWTVNVSVTPYDGTGPVSAYDGECYIYTRASEHYPFKRASIISPRVDISQLQDPVLSFAYHMYGKDMGHLQVWVSIDDGKSWNELICAYNGNKGERWYVAHFGIQRYSGQGIRFKFEGTTGDGVLGDLAIDYVFIGEGSDFSFRDERKDMAWQE